MARTSAFVPTIPLRYNKLYMVLHLRHNDFDWLLPFYEAVYATNQLINKYFQLIRPPFTLICF